MTVANVWWKNRRSKWIPSANDISNAGNTTKKPHKTTAAQLSEDKGISDYKWWHQLLRKLQTLLTRNTIKWQKHTNNLRKRKYLHTYIHTLASQQNSMALCSVLDAKLRVYELLWQLWCIIFQLHFYHNLTLLHTVCWLYNHIRYPITFYTGDKIIKKDLIEQDL